MSVFNLQQPDRRLQIEASGPGGAGVDDQGPSTRFDQRLVRVAVHDHVGLIGVRQANWSGAAELVTVGDEDLHTSEREIHAPRQIELGVIGVSHDRVNWGDRAELAKNGVATDISGMQDDFDTVQSGQRTCTDEGMSIRDEPDEHAIANRNRQSLIFGIADS